MTAAGSGYGQLVLADAPITKPEQDLLGRDDFARALAEAMVAMPADDGLVVGLCGTWGSGKTSALNLVRYYLGQLDETPRVLVFNPWWFSESDDLLLRFLTQFASAVDRQGVRASQLREALRKYGGVVASAAKLVPGGQLGGELMQQLARALPDDNAAELRERISDLLRKSGERFVVIVDDIDRLCASEVRQVFQLVKAVADFPNTIYLMAFDPEVVVGALDEIHAAGGKGYVDKIVQVEFQLPPPDREQVRMIFTERLNGLLRATVDVDVDEHRWAGFYLDCLDPLLGTVRDVKRYVNALAMTWPLVATEVDLIDFLGVEAIRLRWPQVYRSVLAQKEALVGGVSDSSLSLRRPERDAETHGGVLELLDDEEDRGRCREVLCSLFPRFAYTFDGIRQGTGWEGRWRRERRVCSADHFDVYFRLAVAPDAVSETELRELLTLAADPRALADRFRRLAEERARGRGVSRARIALDRLLDHIPDGLYPRDLARLLTGLYIVADELIELNDRESFVPFGNDTVINWAVQRAVSALEDQPAKLGFLIPLVDSSPSLSAAVLLVGYLEHGAEKQAEMPEAERILDEAGLSALRERALQRIRAAGLCGSLRERPALAHVLAAWARWGNVEEAQRFVSRWVADERGLADFIASSLGYSLGELPAGGTAEPGVRIGVEWARYFPNMAEARARAEALLSALPEWLTPLHCSAIRQFLTATGTGPSEEND